MIKIYHSPLCSKSRAALAIVEQYSGENKLPVEIVNYLETPLDAVQLATLRDLIGKPVVDMLRTNEAEFVALGLSNADEATLLGAVAGCPRLLQRPIVVYRDKAIIARPPELLHDFLK